jgi:hypothetical protein
MSAYPDQGYPHPLGAGGNEVWENGQWSETIRRERRSYKN